MIKMAKGLLFNGDGNNQFLAGVCSMILGISIMMIHNLILWEKAAWYIFGLLLVNTGIFFMYLSMYRLHETRQAPKNVSSAIDLVESYGIRVYEYKPWVASFGLIKDRETLESALAKLQNEGYIFIEGHTRKSLFGSMRPARPTPDEIADKNRRQFRVLSRTSSQAGSN